MVRSKLLLKPESLELKHFYSGYIPSFKVNALNIKEMIAEKVCATADRYAPRDYFDLYNIIKLKLPVSISLVRKSSRQTMKSLSPVIYSRIQTGYSMLGKKTCFRLQAQSCLSQK